MVKPNPSILLAHAVGIIGRADGMVHAATRPEMREALASVALVAKDARAWLNEAQATRDDAALVDVEATLVSQAKRLDDLEDKLRLSADARP